MPATAPFRESSPIEIIQGAIAYAEGAGLYVRLGSYGIACVSSEGPTRWEVDPLSRERGVSVLGAVLLAQQPPAADVPDAAAQALGVDARWLSGFELGMDPGEPVEPTTTDRMILHGWESAMNLRLSILSRRSAKGAR
jgi:hypothetical protein